MSSSTAKLAIENQIKEHVSNLDFKQISVGSMKLKRSLIPQDVCERITFHLDLNSTIALSGKAMRMGLTQDELLRQAVWTLTAA